jgi:hypothetical protein
MKDEVRTAACAAFSCVLVAGVFRQRTHRLITPDLILIWRFVSASAMVAACGYLYKISIRELLSASTSATTCTDP